MTKQEKVEQRVNTIVDRIERGGLKWSANIKGSNGQDYVITEREDKESFIAALTPVIAEIVEAEE